MSFIAIAIIDRAQAVSDRPSPRPLRITPTRGP